MIVNVFVANSLCTSSYLFSTDFRSRIAELNGINIFEALEIFSRFHSQMPSKNFLLTYRPPSSEIKRPSPLTLSTLASVICKHLLIVQLKKSIFYFQFLCVFFFFFKFLVSLTTYWDLVVFCVISFVFIFSGCKFIVHKLNVPLDWFLNLLGP